MTIGGSLFLIALGAILYFAVDATVSGLEITTVGLILMIVGIVGLVLGFLVYGRARRVDAVAVRDVREPRDPLV